MKTITRNAINFTRITDDNQTSREAAKGYGDEGMSCIPLDPSVKGQKIRWKDRDFGPEHFADTDNIAVKNGRPSGGRVAVDADTGISRQVWRELYGDTVTGGRTEDSHWWYRVTGYDHAKGIKSETQRFKNPDKKNLYEYRADGSITVVYPSTHPSGAKYKWYGDFRDMKVIDAEELRRRVRVAYTFALIAERMPENSRHDYGLAAAGLLLKEIKMDPDEAGRGLDAVWTVTGAYDGDDPRKTQDEVAAFVPDTLETMGSGEPVTRGGTLDEVATAPIAGLIRKAWGVKAKSFDVPTHDELRDRFTEARQDVAYGLGEWRRYEGGIWVPEDELQVHKGVTTVLEAAKDEGIRPTKSLVDSVAGMVKIKTFVPDWIWNRDVGRLVLGNGSLDIRSRKLRDHSPADYATERLPYAYDPQAWPKIFDNFVRKTLPDSWEFVQEFFGYCLTPDCSHETALWLYGVRGSGKSTLMEGLMAMLGHRYGRLGLSNIQNGRFGLANLPGKYVLGATEQPASYVAATDTLDSIISGEEVDVERKFKDVVTVRSTAKIVWAMNDLPRIGNTTSGTFRRVKVIEFPEPTGRDPRVKARIKGEGAGILNWSLVGLDRLNRRGFFDIPPSVVSATEEFQKDNDIPKLFVEDHCIVGDGHRVQAQWLYDRYAAWCKRNGHKPQSATRVAHDWERLGFEKYPSKGKNFYRGLKVPELSDLDPRGR